MDINIETNLKQELLGDHVGDISSAVRVAYRQAERITQEERLLTIKNSIMSRGHLRYFMVNNSLWHIANEGLLGDVKAVWNEVNQAFFTLTLETPTFSIEPIHVSDEYDKPKTGVTRSMRIATNQQIIPSMMDMFPDSGEKVHLFLLHGNHDLDFIRFACLDSLLPGKTYCYFSTENYAHSGFVSRAAEEVVSEYEPKLIEKVSQTRTGTNGR